MGYIFAVLYLHNQYILYIYAISIRSVDIYAILCDIGVQNNLLGQQDYQKLSILKFYEFFT